MQVRSKLDFEKDSMFRLLIPALAPIGVFLTMAVSALSGYHVLNELSREIRSNNQTIELNSFYVVGELGLLLFGVAVAYSAILRRERNSLTIGLLLGAGVLLGIACLIIGFGNWILMSAFQSLASSDVIDPEEFRRQIASAKTPLLFGWGSALIGAMLIFLSSLKSPSEPTPISFSAITGLLVALFSCVLFVLAIAYEVLSFRNLTTDLGDPPFDPAKLASGATGILLARFLSIVGIAACAVASVLMAVSAMPVRNTEDG